MNSCENCFCFGGTTRICHYTEDEKDCIESDYKYWCPNYILMVKENFDLKQELEVYKLAIFKASERFYNCLAANREKIEIEDIVLVYLNEARKELFK